MVLVSEYISATMAANGARETFNSTGHAVSAQRQNMIDIARRQLAEIDDAPPIEHYIFVVSDGQDGLFVPERYRSHMSRGRTPEEVFVSFMDYQNEHCPCGGFDHFETITPGRTGSDTLTIRCNTNNTLCPSGWLVEINSDAWNHRVSELDHRVEAVRVE